MKEKNLYHDFVETYTTVLFALGIAVLTGFGWTYLGISFLGQSVAEAQFYSFVFAAGFSLVYSIEHIEKVKFREQAEEGDSN